MKWRRKQSTKPSTAELQAFWTWADRFYKGSRSVVSTVLHPASLDGLIRDTATVQRTDDDAPDDGHLGHREPESEDPSPTPG